MQRMAEQTGMMVRMVWVLLLLLLSWVMMVLRMRL